MTEENPSIQEDDFETPQEVDLNFGDLDFVEEAEILSLMEVGRLSQVFNILGGHKVLLKMPSHADEMKMFHAIKAYKDSDAFPIAYRLAKVATFLQEIDGKEVFSQLKPNDSIDVPKKMDILGEYHMSVIDSIYEKTKELEEETTEALNKLGK